jgi:heme-degrading monooxygenase HmoA
MVIREWRGRASKSRGGAYVEHFNTQVLPQLKKVPGFVGAHLCCRPKGELVEFVVLSRWESYDAIRGFAGPDVDAAVVAPAAAATLSDFDPVVQHYEILTDVSV